LSLRPKKAVKEMDIVLIGLVLNLKELGMLKYNPINSNKTFQVEAIRFDVQDTTMNIILPLLWEWPENSIKRCIPEVISSVFGGK
jgi:hypothetical protein